MNDLPAWPKPAISDAEGRFTIRGVGRDLRVDLMIDDPRFARQRIQVDTDGASESKPLTLALEPARIIKGRVTDADTGKPIPHAQVSGLVLSTETQGILNEFEADAEGRFRANPLSGRPLRGFGDGSRGAALPGRLEDCSTGPRGPSSIRSTWPCPEAW